MKPQTGRNASVGCNFSVRWKHSTDRWSHTTDQ